MAQGLDIAHDEVVLADMTSPLTSLVFPLLEFIVVTGVCWIAIGFIDAHEFPLLLRNLIVLVWGAVGVVRFVWPLTTLRRRRFVVTDRRVLARSSRGVIDSIPLDQIHFARRDHGGIMVGVYGMEQPIYFSDVARSRKVEKILRAQMVQPRRF